MGLDISKIANAELKKLAFLKDENNNGKLDGKEITLFETKAAAMKEVSTEDFNQAMGLYQSNPIKAKNNKAEIKENNDEGKTTLSKKDLRDHKNRVKKTLKDMEKVNYLYTSKDDLAKALKEKFAHNEYNSLHADIEEVLNRVPEFNSKDDVKNIKKTVEEKLNMNGFQKDVLDAVVKFAENAQIQKELDAAIVLYNNAKKGQGNNINYKQAYETAESNVVKGSYSDKVKNLLEKHAKADALEQANALAVSNSKTLEEKDMREDLKNKVQKGDDFLKKAIKDKDNMVEIAVRRNKIQTREVDLTKISGKEIEEELGYKLYQKLRQSYLKNDQATYDLTDLVNAVKNRIGSEVLVKINDDLPMSELEHIKNDFESIIKDKLTNKETTKLLELIRAEVYEKDRSFKTAMEESFDGIFPGLAGAVSASRVLDMRQNMSIVCTMSESQDFLGQLKAQGITPDITELGEGNIKIELNQEMRVNPTVLNALVGAGVGFASRALATLIFGKADYEKSCVSIADYDPQDPKYTNLDSYKKYLQKKLPQDKANALIAIAENCKNSKGEFDKAQFDSLMKHIAGVGSPVTCDEIKGHSYGIKFNRTEATGATGANAQQTSTETNTQNSTVITQGQLAEKAPVFEDIPVIDGSRTSWAKIAGQYDCLVEKYGLSAAIRMIKIAQAINNGDYSEDTLVDLYRKSLRGLNNMKNLENIDFEKYKNVLLATSLDDREFDNKGNLVAGTGVKVPDELAGCNRNKDKSLKITEKLAQAKGNSAKAPEGHAADRRKVQEGQAGKFGYRVNGGQVIECENAADLDAKVKEAKALAEKNNERVTVEKIKPWDEFNK